MKKNKVIFRISKTLTTQIIITFDKGENCFCCNDKFDKETTITKTFNSVKEAMDFQKFVNRTKKLKTEYQQLIGKRK